MRVLAEYTHAGILACWDMHEHCCSYQLLCHLSQLSTDSKCWVLFVTVVELLLLCSIYVGIRQARDVSRIVAVML